MSESYPEAQIESLLGLLAQLRRALPGLRWIAGHDALDQRREPASDNPDLMLARRLDPGPMFPGQGCSRNAGLRAGAIPHRREMRWAWLYCTPFSCGAAK